MLNSPPPTGSSSLASRTRMSGGPPDVSGAVSAVCTPPAVLAAPVAVISGVALGRGVSSVGLVVGVGEGASMTISSVGVMMTSVGMGVSVAGAGVAVIINGVLVGPKAAP